MPLLWGGRAQAFHWMIRHGYATCATCHADPSGGGLLTAYGRGLAETSLRTRWGKQSEEAEPKYAGFLVGAVKLPERLLVQVDARGMGLVPTTAPSANSHFYLMQADAAAQLKLSRFRANGSLGFANEGAIGASVNRGGTQDNRLIARTYWAGVDLGADDQFLLRAGRLNLPFGVRNIEHTMFVRKTTRTNVNDQQQHGVSLAWNASKIRAELMAVLGNFQMGPDDFRERGYSGYFEWAPLEKLAVGASSLVTHAALDAQLDTALWRHAHGLFARWSPREWVVLTAETDFLLFSQPPNGPAAANNVAGNASLLMADFEPWHGLHLFGAGEVQKNGNAKTQTTDYGFWAGVWWFFLPHLDARVDANYASAGGKDGTVFLFQLHGYL